MEKVLASVLACFAATVTFAGDLQPRTCSSPDGQYALTVNPAERSGKGPGTYTLKHGGKQLWSIELPFAMQDAAIDDEGRFGGYAYTGGNEHADGEFVAAIVGADGRIVAQERAPREGTLFLHAPPTPHVLGLIRDDDTHRLAIRVADADLNADVEAWWTFDLAAGRFVGKLQPKMLMPDSERASIIAARHIAKTPLTLVQWSTSRGDDEGTRFTLVDTNAAPVWTLDWPSDYTKLVDDPADRLLRRLRAESAILATDTRAFDLWKVADRTRVSFEIAPDTASASGWRISERARRPQADLPPARIVRADPPAKTGALRPLGTITLGKSRGSTIGDISDFTVADGGRFAFLRSCSCEENADIALVVVDRRGQTLREVALPVARDSARYESVWTGGDRWVVTRSTHGVHTVSTAWAFDAAAGTATKLTAFEAPEINTLASLGDGGFVAIASDWSKDTMNNVLLAFDADGTRRWTIRGDYSEQSPIFAPKAVAVTPSREIVVLDDIIGELRIFDATGKLLRKLDLADAWRRKPNYPTGISADPTGGVVVHDFEGKPAVVHMQLDGRIVRQFNPAFEDGRRFELIGHVQVADDGTYWTSDGSAILGLDERGIVDRVVGEKPQLESLQDIAAITVGAKGSIYAADAHTGAVHVFDRDGHPMRVLRPAATDYDGRVFPSTLTVSDAGDVFIARSDGAEPPDFLHYAPDGKRLGIETTTLDRISQDWYAAAGSTRRWIVGYENVFLVAEDGKVLHRIERDANGGWLTHPGPAAVAADGSIAILGGARASPPGEDGPVSVTVYTRDAIARDTWLVPQGFIESRGNLAWDGEHAAFLASTTQDYPADRLVLDTIGAHERTTFPIEVKANAAVFLVRPAATREIWLFDGDATVQRYSMP